MKFSRCRGDLRKHLQIFKLYCRKASTTHTQPVFTWELKVSPLVWRSTEAVPIVVEVLAAGDEQFVTPLFSITLGIKFDEEVDRSRDVNLILGKRAQAKVNEGAALAALGVAREGEGKTEPDMTVQPQEGEEKQNKKQRVSFIAYGREPGCLSARNARLETSVRLCLFFK